MLKQEDHPLFGVPTFDFYEYGSWTDRYEGEGNASHILNNLDWKMTSD